MRNSFLKRNTLFAALLILLCVLLAACNGKHKLSSGENTEADYPYAWAEQRNGSFTLRVGGDRPEDFSWTCFSDTPECVTVEYTGENKGDSVFSVKPLELGSATVTLKLTDSSLPTDAGALLHFSFTVSDKKIMTLDGSDSAAISVNAAEEDGENPVYWLDGKGSATVYVLGEGEWLAEETESNIYAVGPMELENGRSFRIHANEDGEGTAALVCADRKLRYVFTVTVADGLITVTDFSTETYTAPEEAASSMTLDEMQKLIQDSGENANIPQGLLDLLLPGTGTPEPVTDSFTAEPDPAGSTAEGGN